MPGSQSWRSLCAKPSSRPRLPRACLLLAVPCEAARSLASLSTFNWCRGGVTVRRGGGMNNVARGTLFSAPEKAVTNWGFRQRCEDAMGHVTLRWGAQVPDGIRPFRYGAFLNVNNCHKTPSRVSRLPRLAVVVPQKQPREDSFLLVPGLLRPRATPGTQTYNLLLSFYLHLRIGCSAEGHSFCETCKIRVHVNAKINLNDDNNNCCCC